MDRQEFDPVRTAVHADVDGGRRTTTAMIDVGRALNLLTTAVIQREVFRAHRRPAAVVPVYGRRGSQCLVGRCLSLAGVSDEELDALDGHALRELYRRGALPVPVTLGALVLFDAVQRGQDQGYAPGEALEYAVGVVERFLDLIPPSTRRQARSGAICSSPRRSPRLGDCCSATTTGSSPERCCSSARTSTD
jgi:hypothetical protein